jgi:purine-binding chemotaxis protein CheW
VTGEREENRVTLATARAEPAQRASTGAARVSRPRAGAQGVRELLAFRLGAEAYALPLASVREIARLGPLTEVPRAPADVLGVVSVRGRVTTVLDLRKRLRLEATQPTRHTRVLFVDAGAEVLGLLVDAVLQVYRLRDDEFEPGAGRPGEAGDAVVGLGRPAPVRAPTRPPRASESPSRALPAPGDAPVTLLIVLDPRALWRG